MALSAFFAAWLIHLIAAASPGPANLMAARIGVTDGLRSGAFLAIGLGLGAVFWAVSAIFGLAILFKIAPGFLLGMKVAGGLFLMWIAFQMWKNAPEPLQQNLDRSEKISALDAMKLGLATQLSNPKPAIFFGAVFVGTVPPNTSALALIALLIAIFINEFACNIIVARMFSFQTIRATYQRLKTIVDRCFGSVLALLGAKVAFT